MKLLLVATMALPTIANAETGKADPRAISACQSMNLSFTEVSECIGGANTAFAVFDAFDEIYDDAALPVKERCIELNTGEGTNDGPAGAKACITNAIESALFYASATPEDAMPDDPMFVALTDKGKFQQLLAREEKARSMFPDNQPLAVSYMPYR